jgi:hypothetical protein
MMAQANNKAYGFIQFLLMMFVVELIKAFVLSFYFFHKLTATIIKHIAIIDLVKFNNESSAVTFEGPIRNAIIIVITEINL